MAIFIVFSIWFPGPSGPASRSSEQTGTKSGIFNHPKIIMVKQIISTKCSVKTNNTKYDIQKGLLRSFILIENSIENGLYQKISHAHIQQHNYLLLRNVLQPLWLLQLLQMSLEPTVPHCGGTNRPVEFLHPHPTPNCYNNVKLEIGGTMVELR